jgi:hypothetical protein
MNSQNEDRNEMTDEKLKELLRLLRLPNGTVDSIHELPPDFQALYKKLEESGVDTLLRILPNRYAAGDLAASLLDTLIDNSVHLESAPPPEHDKKNTVAASLEQAGDRERPATRDSFDVVREMLLAREAGLIDMTTLRDALPHLQEIARRIESLHAQSPYYASLGLSEAVHELLKLMPNPAKKVEIPSARLETHR